MSAEHKKQIKEGVDFLTEVLYNLIVQNQLAPGRKVAKTLKLFYFSWRSWCLCVRFVTWYLDTIHLTTAKDTER